MMMQGPLVSQNVHACLQKGGNDGAIIADAATAGAALPGSNGPDANS